MSVSEEMENKIKERLNIIEREHGLTILAALESGSRAWGFPSPDSDYDVRFIFIKPRGQYLSIAGGKDTLSFPITDELDLTGWDIKKVLAHIHKSSAQLLEWFGSPIIYGQKADFLYRVKALGKDYFNPARVLHHYRGLTKKFYPYARDQEQTGIKKLFYILRPLLAGWWVIENKTPPPTEFSRLLSLVETQEELSREISRLLEIKKGAREGELITIPGEISRFIKQRKVLNEQSDVPNNPANGIEKLDRFFLELLEGETL